MKKNPWLIEPVTGARYVLDQVPKEPTYPIQAYKRLDDFTPPATWGDYEPFDSRWDTSFVKTWKEEYSALKQADPTAPTTVNHQAVMFGKSYARKNGLKTVGGPGVVFWTWFPRIPPCWLIITKTQAYKMVAEADSSVKH